MNIQTILAIDITNTTTTTITTTITITRMRDTVIIQKKKSSNKL